MLIGAIGDDFTGSSSLAAMLSKAGLRTAHCLGVPTADPDPDDEAVVIALPLRSAPAAEAVRLALEAFAWLREHAAQKIYFNIAPTFDSTPAGNIGPVLDALLEALGSAKAIVCPAAPEDGRTLYQGHLFVGGRLLSESGMENHPVTPMTDADVRRLLRRQSRSSVGHVSHLAVRRGVNVLRAAVEDAPDRLLLIDATADEDLRTIAEVARDLPLVCGSHGLAGFLPAAIGRPTPRRPRSFMGVPGPGVVLSASSSTATRAQVALYARTRPSFLIDPDRLMAGSLSLRTIVDFLETNREREPIVHAPTDPIVVATAQARHGRDALARRTEDLLVEITQAAIAKGFTRLVVAGGSASSAVARALGTAALTIGPEIDAGIPAIRLRGEAPLAIAWKSGNFGARDFFERALARLGGPAPRPVASDPPPQP